MNKENKKALITGGLGFIGTHLIEKLLSMNYDITVIDNMSTNTIDTDHSLAKQCNVIVENILNVSWKDLDRFDAIFHLASPVGPVGVLKKSGEMAKIILDDIYWAIKVAKINKCPLIFVSTSEIYGHRDEKTYLSEDGDKVLKGSFTVRNEYAIAKLLAEIVLANTSKIDKDLKYQIIRPFNVSGEHQLPDGGFVLPRFVTQALSGKDITVYYTGEQIRAFTWVKDIVEGICLTLDAPESLYNEEWNIGNKHNEKSILYLAERVKSLTTSDSKIIHVDPVKLHGKLFAEAPEKIPDATKITNKLGWIPTKQIDDVILEIIEYYKEKNSNV